MTTVAISKVSRGELYEPFDLETSVRNLLAKPVEAFGCSAERLVSCDTQHALAKAAHDAFYGHHPLVLRPDDVWFCIAQGFATHVRLHSEELRSRFVRHQGKAKLIVERADFFLGQSNPWPEAFAAFSSQIGDHVGKLQQLVSAHFSTTTPTEVAAFDVCLMDTFQGYFEYEMRCGCGIPEITLLGTPEDWASMVPRVRHLSEYGLTPWCDALVPILEKLALTAAGDVDDDFWRSFFRYESGSGGSELTGWIVTLFPYLIDHLDGGALKRNPHLASWRNGFDAAERRRDWLRSGGAHGPDLTAVPGSLASAPVRFIDVSTGEQHDLRFVAGLFGVEQNASTGALSASFGWAVVYDDPNAVVHRERRPVTI